jgi:hypothetical protein
LLISLLQVWRGLEKMRIAVIDRWSAAYSSNDPSPFFTTRTTISRNAISIEAEIGCLCVDLFRLS